MANTAVSVQSQSFERCSTAHSYYKGSVSSVSKLSACGREDNLTPRMFLDRYSLPRVVKIVPQVRISNQPQIRLFTHFFIPNLLTTVPIKFGIIIWNSTVLFLKVVKFIQIKSIIYYRMHDKVKNIYTVQFLLVNTFVWVG